MINLKKEFYKRFVGIDDYNELRRIARERRDISTQKNEKISALVEENIKLVEDVEVKKERIVELAIANNDLMRDYNQRFIDLQQERRAHKVMKICCAALGVINLVLVGALAGWWLYV